MHRPIKSNFGAGDTVSANMLTRPLYPKEAGEAPLAGAALAGQQFPRWMIRRAALLHEGFAEIQAKRAAGTPVRPSIRRMRRNLKGKSLGQGKKMHASVSRLANLYYQWRQIPSPRIFCYKFWPRRLVPKAVFNAFLNLLCDPSVQSIQAAYD